MPPAASRAPREFLFALVCCAVPILVSFKVDPPETRWIVFAVGCVMAVAVLAAALRPLHSDRR